MKTIDQVIALFPNTRPEQWRQHANGGGWVLKTARVEDTARIEGIVSGDARVFGYARVGGNAQVFDYARVSGGARVFGYARVGGYAWVGGNAQVFGYAWVGSNAQVFGYARVGGNAQVFGYARVSGGAWRQSPLYIQGSKHALTMCSLSEIAIGCHIKTVSEWRKHYQRIGKQNGYTPAEIKEYGRYIALFAATARELQKAKEKSK